MSTDTKQLEFDSKKYVALVYDAGGAIYEMFDGDHQEVVNRNAVCEYNALVQSAKDDGGDPNLPIWDSYTRDRDVRKLVEEAYAKGLADGKAGK